MEIMEEPPPAAGGDDDREVELPEDVLAEILRRLPPRSLAASRCVCTDWRSAIDSRRLLRPPAVARRHFHPLQRPHVPGVLLSSIFVTDNQQSPDIGDHCNGLLLLFSLLVVNPATRRWARLPPLPRTFAKLESGFFDKEFIVFDTTLSPHYEVFNIQFVDVGWYNVKTMDPVLKKSEWPPSPLVLHVFSSATGRWEERSFSREGDAAGTVASAQRLCRPEQCGYHV
ncbi:putative F-box/kelch-repeat protein At1g15680 [Oryza sativa Japonica Group]|uniref:putative F-box/kelch-repeat protein At1g15680 n=1 Tax=Oryza sativa subsp. japonica TaxID=39947 RepID=UPI0000F1A09B|nr:F-box domain-containing protein [Oryza sativa Japonica Group]